MTPKPLIPMGIEAFKLEESANDNHYAAFFSGYSGYMFDPWEMDALKAALREEWCDSTPVLKASITDSQVGDGMWSVTSGGISIGTKNAKSI